MASSDRSYNAAIIGGGAARKTTVPKTEGVRIGYTHGQMYRDNPRTRLVAAADINRKNLDAFAAQFEVPRTFADYRQMLRDVRPDVVSISTGVLPHAEMIQAACDAGVGVILCEKPFVASPAQLLAVRRAVARSGARLAIAHVRRNRPAFIRARELY